MARKSTRRMSTHCRITIKKTQNLIVTGLTDRMTNHLEKSNRRNRRKLSEVKAVKMTSARSITIVTGSLTGSINRAAVVKVKTVKARRTLMKNKAFTPTMSAEFGPSMRKRLIKMKQQPKK